MMHSDTKQTITKNDRKKNKNNLFTTRDSSFQYICVKSECGEMCCVLMVIVALKTNRHTYHSSLSQSSRYCTYIHEID